MGKRKQQLNLSPEAPIVTNAQGGKGSDVGCSMMDCPAAFLAVGAVFHYGAKKYERFNWHKVSVDENVNHALVHLMAYAQGDTQDDHLHHAACRIMMALDNHLVGR